MIAMYGIPLFLLWIYLTFNAFRVMFSFRETLFVILVLIILGSAEVYNSFILYMSFPFLILGRKNNVFLKTSKY